MKWTVVSVPQIYTVVKEQIIGYCGISSFLIASRIVAKQLDERAYWLQFCDVF